MASPLTPPENLLSADQIPAYRQARRKTTFQGCSQVNQIFLKSDGKFSCSCLKYWDILGDARELDAADFFNGELMRYIRESFREGYEPFSFCGNCPSRNATFDYSNKSISLHIEPTNQCNLFCEACICTIERSTSNMPPRGILPYDLYEKFVSDVAAGGLVVGTVSFVGFGEPLFNSRIPDMARLARKLFPVATVLVDTNANFGKLRAKEIANCGITEIRLGMDGSDQESYSTYRKNGDFKKTVVFAKELAEQVRETGSQTRVVWKYILFAHNDSDDHLKAAKEIADQIQIPIAFDSTVGKIASKRTIEELRRVLGDDVEINCNIDQSSFSEPLSAKPPSIIARLLAPNLVRRLRTRIKRELITRRQPDEALSDGESTKPL